MRSLPRLNPQQLAIPVRALELLRRHAYTLCSVAIFGLTVFLFWRLLHDPRIPIEYTQAVFFGSDVLHGASLYEDLFVDGYSLKSFQFSAATFWVPDLAIYFTWRTILGAVAPAMWATVATMFVFHLGAAIRFGRALVGPRSARFVGPSILLAGGIYLGASGLSGFTEQEEREFYLPGYHSGAVLLGYLAFAAVIRVSRSPNRWGFAPFHLATIILVTTAATFSDRLFGLWFVGPVAFGVLGVKLLARDESLPLTWRKVLTLGIAVAIGTAGGMALLKWFQTTAGDPISNYWVGAEWDVLLSQLILFAKVMLQEFQNGNWLAMSCAAWNGLSCLYLGRVLVRRVLARQRAGDGPMLFFHLVGLSMTVATVLVFLLSKAGVSYLATTDWGDLSRYFNGPISFAFFGWFILLARIAGDESRSRALREAAVAVPVALALGVVVALVYFFPEPEPQRDLVHFRPKYVTELDAICQKYDLHDGLAAYALAKQTTLLSEFGVKLRPIETVDKAPSGITALHWLSNSEYYWKPPRGRERPVKFEFIVTHPNSPGMPKAEEMIRIFGEPAIREKAGEYDVLIYNRPSDFKLHHFPELDTRCITLKANHEGWEKITYPAASFWGRRPIPNDPNWRDRTASEESHKGIFAFGPYIDRLKPGHYKITFRTTTTGTTEPNGAFDVMYSDLSKNFEVPVAVDMVPVGVNQQKSFDVYVPNSAKQPRLEFRTFYHGVGTLTLHDVTIERLPPAPRRSR